VLYEPPYGPEDLKEPALEGAKFIDHLLAQKTPGLPSFYEDLAAGKLHRQDLQVWVKDMYSYWQHALVYSTGAILIKTNDEATRTHILRKLIDLEGEDVVHDLTGWTTPSYAELWLRFGEALGLSREEITGWRPFTRSYYAQSVLCMLSRWWEWSWLDGIASFYAGDLLGQECLTAACDALQRHYGIGEAGLEFFRVYLDDVAAHIPWERDTLAYWCCTRERQLTAAKAFRHRLALEHQLVLRVHTAATAGELPLQVAAESLRAVASSPDEFLQELENLRHEFYKGRALRVRSHHATREEAAAAKRRHHTGGPIHNHKYVGEKYFNAVDPELRRLNLRKMIDELGQTTVGVGLPSHPTLLRWGSYPFGLDDQEIDRLEKEDMPPDAFLWNAMKVNLHRNSHWAVGIALSLVGEGEKLKPELRQQLLDDIEQLKHEYAAMGIQDVDKALAFESEHAAVDVEHAEISIKAIREHINTPELQDEFRRAYILTLQQKGY